MLLFKEKFKRTQVYNKNIKYKHSKKLKRKKKIKNIKIISKIFIFSKYIFIFFVIKFNNLINLTNQILSIIIPVILLICT